MTSARTGRNQSQPKRVPGFTADNDNYSLKLNSPVTLKPEQLAANLYEALASGYYTTVDLSDLKIANNENADDHMALQKSLILVVASHLTKETCQLTTLILNNWIIPGKSDKKNDHKADILRILGKELRDNSTLTQLSLQKSSFGHSALLALFFGLYDMHNNGNVKNFSDPNLDKGKSQLAQIVCDGNITDKMYAESVLNTAAKTGITLVCEFELKNTPVQKAVAPVIIADTQPSTPASPKIDDAANDNIPTAPTIERSFANFAKSIALYLGGSLLIGVSIGGVVAVAGVLAETFFGVAAFSFLGAALTLSGIGLAIGIGILAGIAIGGLIYGIYEAEQAYQAERLHNNAETVAQEDQVKPFNTKQVNAALPKNQATKPGAPAAATAEQEPVDAILDDQTEEPLIPNTVPSKAPRR